MKICVTFILLCVLGLAVSIEPQEKTDSKKSVVQQENKSDKQDKSDKQQESKDNSKTKKSKHGEFEIPKHWVRLAKKREVWADFKNKQVIVKGKICLEKGMLELFACCMEAKSHESIVTVNALSSEVHAGLIAVGAKPGHPVLFDPKYVPAAGPKVELTVVWMKDGKRVKCRAQDMIKNAKTKKKLDIDFVFGGSMVWTDPDTGEKFYYGDSGDFVCVSNFASATLDLPIKSSASADDLIWEANSEKIPALGTPVLLYLKPEIKKEGKKPAKGKDGAKSDSSKKTDKADKTKAKAGDSGKIKK